MRQVALVTGSSRGIGKAIAQRAAAFQMQIAYTARTPKADLPYEFVASVKDLAARSDFLLAITPGGEATKGMINAEVLQALGPRGFFINIARGSVADQPALIEALKNNTIAGAALDVFAQEPLPADHALWSMKNVIITPHLGGLSHDSSAHTMPALTHNMRCFLNGDLKGMMNVARPAA